MLHVRGKINIDFNNVCCHLLHLIIRKQILIPVNNGDSLQVEIRSFYRIEKPHAHHRKSPRLFSYHWCSLVSRQRSHFFHEHIARTWSPQRVSDEDEVMPSVSNIIIDHADAHNSCRLENNDPSGMAVTRWIYLKIHSDAAGKMLLVLMCPTTTNWTRERKRTLTTAENERVLISLWFSNSEKQDMLCYSLPGEG